MNNNKIKMFVAIFICLSSMHLEVLSDLTTEAFYTTLKFL